MILAMINYSTHRRKTSWKHNTFASGSMPAEVEDPLKDKPVPVLFAIAFNAFILVGCVKEAKASFCAKDAKS